METERIAWTQKSRNFGRRFALEGRFVGHGRLSGVVSQTRLFSREEFGGRGALAEERGCKSKDSGEVEAAAKFASQLVSAGTRRDKLSQSR
jgi:hypothetical protein